ncbi:MAG TPA: hypothetical protein VF525_14030 [Pyrinomonadaceae bacterium]
MSRGLTAAARDNNQAQQGNDASAGVHHRKRENSLTGRELASVR